MLAGAFGKSQQENHRAEFRGLQGGRKTVDIVERADTRDFPGGASGKGPACQCRRPGFDPWVGKIPQEEGMTAHSSIRAWRIPWTEEPGGLQSIGSQRVRQD